VRVTKEIDGQYTYYLRNASWIKGVFVMPLGGIPFSKREFTILVPEGEPESVEIGHPFEEFVQEATPVFTGTFRTKRAAARAGLAKISEETGQSADQSVII
jgi:hypothetical protein